MRIVLTGGGTGGHICPLAAVASQLRLNEQDKNIELLWLGEAGGREELAAKRLNIKFTGLLCGKVRRYFSIRNLFDLIKLPLGFMQAFLILAKFKPRVVFSKGGYVSWPVSLAASLMGIKVVLHESDMVMGLTNKILARFASKVLLGWPIKENLDIKGEIKVVGNPIRSEVLTADRATALNFFKLAGKSPVVLVLGGSQGASEINKFISANLGELLSVCRIIHLTGKNKKEIESRDGYYVAEELSASDLALAYVLADLIISRAGANTLAEIAAWAKPTVLLPLASSANNHQLANAEYFASQQAAVICEPGIADNLKLLVVNLLRDQNKLLLLAKNVKKLAYPNANQNIAGEILKYA